MSVETESSDEERKCWELLLSVLNAEHPTDLQESLRLTRIAEDLKYHKAGMVAAGSGS